MTKTVTENLPVTLEKHNYPVGWAVAMGLQLQFHAPASLASPTCRVVCRFNEAPAPFQNLKIVPSLSVPPNAVVP